VLPGNIIVTGAVSRCSRICNLLRPYISLEVIKLKLEGMLSSVSGVVLIILSAYLLAAIAV